ncbi:MAG: DUF983 domain-containing protein [Pseudomonadota bacterium]
MTPKTPIRAGLQCKCFRCGQGSVFDGYLKLRSQCAVCGQDFTKGDTADGPAFFVMFVALILFAPFFFLLPLLDWSLWALALGFILLMALTLGFILWALRPFKAVLLNLQLANRAEEAAFEEESLDV